MPELREIIYRLRLKQSIREIHRDTGTHRTIIRRIRNLARHHDWLNEERPMPSEHELRNELDKESGKEKKAHPLDRYTEDIRHWVEGGYTFTVMHQLLEGLHQCDESTVRRYVSRNFSEKSRPVIRRLTNPGEIMEVDFGYLGLTFDPETMRIRKTYVFSARLRHSRRAYRAMTYDQTQETFFRCHIHAFEYFGGVPRKVVPDNLKAAVIKACYEDPLVNRSYRMLAEHYGFTISPTLPYTPRHKGGVENDIKFVKKNFWPIFKERERAKGRDIPYGDEIQTRLDEWSAKVEERIVRGVGISPADTFRLEKAEALKSLPHTRWEPPVWKTCKVRTDWHVQFCKAYYSLPYRHIGEAVQVCGTSSIVRIFRDFEEIACHLPATVIWEKVSRKEHAPPNAEEYLNMTGKGLLIKSSELGTPILRVAENIFADKAVDGLRPVRALLKMKDKYGLERLLSACERALQFNMPTYASIKNILKKGLDIENNEIAAKRETQNEYRFEREGGFFNPDNYVKRGGKHG